VISQPRDRVKCETFFTSNGSSKLRGNTDRLQKDYHSHPSRLEKNMNRLPSLLIATVALVGLFAEVGVAAKKANHHNGKQLLGQKIKTNGNHVIEKKGPFTASVEVKGGKVAGVHVKHDKKGEVAVKKYKSDKKMARSDGEVSFILVQEQYLGTVSIGYAYIDEYGEEEIYWFPYDMILDGDTGAVIYVPV